VERIEERCEMITGTQALLVFDLFADDGTPLATISSLHVERIEYFLNE